MKLSCLPDEKYRITDAGMLQEFLCGGQAELTLVGPAGTAHKYLFARPKNSDDFPPDIRFVYVIHEDKRFYIGMLEQGVFRCTAHSKFDESCECVKGARYIVLLSNNQILLNTTKMKLYQSGKCARCGRELDSDNAIKIGFGKKCWNAHQVRREAEEKFCAELRPHNL